MSTDNAASLRCPVADCLESTDMIIKSSDGKLLGAHCARLCQYSPFFPFPPLEDGVLVPPKEPLGLAETSAVLEILMHYFHPELSLPKTELIPINHLEQLAEAARKYDLHSAIEVCRLAMLVHMKEDPSTVVRYAVEHGHRSIANDAAYQCLSMGGASSGGTFYYAPQRVRDAWSKYSEQYKLIYRIINDSNPIPNAHAGGTRDCRYWDKFVNRVKSIARQKAKSNSNLLYSDDFIGVMTRMSEEVKGGLEYCKSCNSHAVHRWWDSSQRSLPSKKHYWDLLT